MYPLGDGRLFMPPHSIRHNLKILISVSFPNKIPKRWSRILFKIDKLPDFKLEQFVWDLVLSQSGLSPIISGAKR